MPLTRFNSVKGSRKWAACGKRMKFIKLGDGCSNKRPTRKLRDYIKEYIKEQIDE